MQGEQITPSGKQQQVREPHGDHRREQAVMSGGAGSCQQSVVEQGDPERLGEAATLAGTGRLDPQRHAEQREDKRCEGEGESLVDFRAHGVLRILFSALADRRA